MPLGSRQHQFQQGVYQQKAGRVVITHAVEHGARGNSAAIIWRENVLLNSSFRAVTSSPAKAFQLHSSVLVFVFYLVRANFTLQI